MSHIDDLKQQFRDSFGRFLSDCDKVTEAGRWDVERDGSMDVFFVNDLTSIIIHLIAADGRVTPREVGFLSDSFGLSYSVDELAEVYGACGDAIDQAHSEGVVEDVAMLEGIDSALADEYKRLLKLACEIAIASDNVHAVEEIREVNKLLGKIE